MGSWSPINWVNAGGSGPYQQANDTENFKTFGTSPSVNGIRTIGCPPGHYMYQMSGRAGSAVDQLNALGCRNIINNNTTTVYGQGSLGSSSGGVPVTITANGSDGNHGLYIRSHTEVEHVMPIWRSGVGPGNCCNGAEYDANNLFGPRQNLNWTKYYCDQNHMIDSISGGTAKNNLLNNFSFTCRNFANMSNIGKSPLNCCVGNDTSQDCADVKQYLNCPAALKTYCGTGDNIINDPICKTAIGNKTISEQDGDSMRFAWCSQGTNFANQNCLDLCTSSTGIDNNVILNNGSNLKQQCNTLYVQKCSDPANQAKYSADVCSCNLPWTSYPGVDLIAKIPGAPASPICYFSQCRSKGYLDKPITAYSCPQCIQNSLIDIKNASNVALNNISQSCNVSSSTSTQNTASPTSAVQSTNAPSSAVASQAAVPSSASAAKLTSSSLSFSSSSTSAYMIILAIICVMLMSSCAAAFLLV